MRGAGSSVRRGSTGGVSAPPSPSGPPGRRDDTECWTFQLCYSSSRTRLLTPVPLVQTVLGSCSPTRSLTSLFSRSEVVVPQIQSSLDWVLFGAFCAIHRTPPRGVQSRGARIFRALDDEEFFVIEGSPGWRGRRM